MLDSSMPEPIEYVAVLRCQTWNVWPEKAVIEDRTFRIEHGSDPPIPARLAIVSYLNRTKPESYLDETTKIGPLVWDGTVRGLYVVRETILKAPEDEIEVALEYRNARKGEVDIGINFKFSGQLPASLLEALRSTASAIMSLVNLRLQDYLTPTAPLQLQRVLNGASSVASGVRIAVRNRKALTKDDISPNVVGIANALVGAQGGEKLRVALELYAAHFIERQARVRFLLLVMAMESLAKPTRKHDVAINLLDRWQRELELEMQTHDRSSQEFVSLEALSRELSFRREDSIRTQVRKLFRGLTGVSRAESDELERRALRVYDKRSTLVHDGHLPTDELTRLETEARELLERVLMSAVEHNSNESPSPSPTGGV